MEILKTKWFLQYLVVKISQFDYLDAEIKEKQIINKIILRLSLQSHIFFYILAELTTEI